MCRLKNTVQLTQVTTSIFITQTLLQIVNVNHLFKSWIRGIPYYDKIRKENMKRQQNITNIPIIKPIRQLKTNSTCSKIKISDTTTVQNNITVKISQNFSTFLIYQGIRIPYSFFFSFFLSEPDPSLFTICHSQTENKYCAAFFPTSPTSGDEICIQAL